MNYVQAIKVLTCLAIISASSVVNAYSDSALNHKLTSMIRTSLPDATVGVTVQDLETGKIIYDYHGAKNFLPASTAKLFSAAAALKELGPNYVYETTLYYNPKGGDVAFKFSGDPSLELANIYSLLGELQKKSQVIKGDLWIDDSIYQGPLLGHGWTWDSTSWYHAAPVSAIIIDRNQFGITLLSAMQPGSKVEVLLDQAYPGAKLRHLKSNVHAATLEESETLCQITAEVDEENNVKINGCWPIDTQPAHLRLAIKNPRYNAQKLILEGLSRLNIKLMGKVKFGKVPANLVKLAHHESKPLSALLNTILRDSNNLYAETLTKTLGAKMYGVGSFKTGSLATQKILAAITGIDFSRARLFDGSGESRYNLLTPLQLSRLLYTMHNEKQLSPYFREALASSGINGTLQNRFASFDTKANIQAKTGTLSGVSALSGYLTTRSKRELIVTIMINHALADNATLKNFENQLCYFLVNQY